MGSCCVAGLVLVWYCYCIYMTFVCLSQKKWIYFGYLRGLGCVESKNKTSAKRKSTMSSLDPSMRGQGGVGILLPKWAGKKTKKKITPKTCCELFIFIEKESKKVKSKNP